MMSRISLAAAADAAAFCAANSETKGGGKRRFPVCAPDGGFLQGVPGLWNREFPPAQRAFFGGEPAESLVLSDQKTGPAKLAGQAFGLNSRKFRARSPQCAQARAEFPSEVEARAFRFPKRP